MINGLQDALIGTGGDVSTIVKDESKLLSLEISHRVGPQDRAKTAQRIDKSVRSKFIALNSDVGFDENTGKEGHSGVKWYRCDKNFLYGVAPDSDLRHADPQTLANIYYRAKKIQGKTRIVVDFKHPRQHQRVAITTKVFTSKSVLNAAVKLVQQSIGKLKASWFATGKKIEPSLVAPQWIERHIHGSSTTKSITDLTGMSDLANPAITFGSKAEGVSKFDRVIQFAVDVRQKKVSARMRLVLSGYSKDVASGIRPRKHAKESNE